MGIFVCDLVGEVGVEPTILSEHGPKPCAYSSSATRPFFLGKASTKKLFRLAAWAVFYRPRKATIIAFRPLALIFYDISRH